MSTAALTLCWRWSGVCACVCVGDASCTLREACEAHGLVRRVSVERVCRLSYVAVVVIRVWGRVRASSRLHHVFGPEGDGERTQGHGRAYTI